MVDVMVVGSGGREHAITWKLLASRQAGEVYVAPGNAGTGLIARNVDVDPLDPDAVIRAAVMRGVRLVVVGPEAPLAAGLVDELRRVGIPTFGPTRAAAEIESSKVFAKDLMRRYQIPCARSEAFDSLSLARQYLAQVSLPVVIKADGLAAGKGVTVAQTREEADRALADCLDRQIFGQAGRRVLIEEFLSGQEVSLLAFTDGRTVVPMAPATDFKRAHDDDEGPNTGGMGAYSPPSFATPEVLERARREILEPTVAALAAEGRPYQGVLYAGLMLTDQGPKVLEFNCRFGDPETQVILPRLESDLLDILQACVEGRLDQVPVDWRGEATVGVVMVSQGYPGHYSTGHLISGLDQLDDGVLAFHSGTVQAAQRPLTSQSRLGRSIFSRIYESDNIFHEIRTSGGRVLTLVGRGPSVSEARALVYRNLPRITFSGARYRSDIAAREGEPTGSGESPGASPATRTLGHAGTVAPAPSIDLTVSKRLPEPVAEERETIERAEREIAAGHNKTAVALLAEAVEQSPESVPLRAALANAQAAHGDLQQARAAWRDVVARAPHAAEAHHNLGVVCLHLREDQVAIECIREALRLDPGFALAHSSLGAIQAGLGDVPSAIAHYEEALRIDPASEITRLDFAAILVKSGQRDRAALELERCLTTTSDPSIKREAEARLKDLKKRRWF
ncbi:MAG TPA: phosphoribosylamine--glycine ligase [Dehalococcoidia bacterium]|nr:phosphoribosylamine--glycine ligase [Dehalococcoidia bacterium]